ncbi:MAG: hypothetical protein HZB46_07660, partial [Solirubrobacterales bacterium]|nr:hypothetical protein [Solirubrobacterales bacterium]
MSRAGAVVSASPTRRLPATLPGPWWLLPLLVGAVVLARRAWWASNAPIARFDHGIELASITMTRHGLLNLADYYQPYGIGLGVPGALISWLGIDGLFAERVVYSLFIALAAGLAVALVLRLRGPAPAAVAAIACLVPGSARYAWGMAAVLGALLLVTMVAQRGGMASLREVHARRPRVVLAASAIVSLAAYARYEYLAFGLVWAVVLLVLLRGARGRRMQAGVAAGLALVPTAMVVVAGGARWLYEFVQYSAGGDFHRLRGIPIDWGAFPAFVGDLAHLRVDDVHAAIVASYGVGAVAVVLAVLALRRRDDPAVALGVLPLLLPVCALVLYGNAQRFSDGYGVAALPVFWTTALLALPVVAGRWRTAALVAAGLLALTLLGPYTPSSLRGEERFADAKEVGFREAVRKLGTVPLDDEWKMLAALPAVWRAHGHAGQPTLVVTDHNDGPNGNEPIIYWLLDAPAAAWPVTYDPGLVDREVVQRDAVRRLCASRAPVVQHGDYLPERPLHGSTLLDEHLAWNTKVQATAGAYRVRVLERGRCDDPRRATPAALRAREQALLDRDDLASAGIVAALRARRSGRPAPADVALATTAGSWLPDDAFPAGPVGSLLRGVRDGSPAGTAAAVQAARGEDALVRLAVLRAWVGRREGDPQAVTPELFRLLDERPSWGAVLRTVAAVVPLDLGALDRLARRGARGAAFERARLDAAIGA